VAQPSQATPDTDIYNLAMQQVNNEILPGVQTQVLTYGGTYVAPTIRATVGRQVQVNYTNQLSSMSANVHLHGAHTPYSSDGYPTDLLTPGDTRAYHYPNNMKGATLWYHDHTMMKDAENVYRGMPGFYILEDPQELQYGLPSGPYDIPLMVSDAQFDSNGALLWALGNEPQQTTMLVNGAPVPYFPVAARKYRFRMLNATTWRFMDLTMQGEAFTQIGSDGGLLPAPLIRTDLPISPGERIEFVVDFAKYAPGSQLVISDATSAGSILRFDVGQPAADNSQVPGQLRPLDPMPVPVTERNFVLSINASNGTGLINGQTFDPNRVDIHVKQGTSEVWTITNSDTTYGLEHNFHMHLAQFKVLDRDGGTAPPLPGESGLKDTVPIGPGHSVRIQAVFNDYLGLFPYHCHIIEHSDMGMMGQMQIET
jgi:FtsP/CotA-like multicopper oxidase with cupredoxin domain